MTIIRKSLACALLLGLSGAPALAQDTPPASKRQADAAWAEEGLERIEIKGFDVVYLRPGAALGAYRQVQLAPVSVAFRRGWEKRTSTGTSIRVRDQDILRIKQGLSELVREQVLAELAEGGYGMAEAPGENVLAVELSIVNLNIKAPDLATPGRVRSYATSAGEMTLVAELRDSVSGELMARILDRARAREHSTPQVMTRVDNVAEAKVMARRWARSLREGLDGARSAAD